MGRQTNKTEGFLWRFELKEFFSWLKTYLLGKFKFVLNAFESVKDLLVGSLSVRRGQYARPFIHGGMVGLVFLGITVGPSLVQSEKDVLAADIVKPQVLGVSTVEIYAQGTTTVSGEGVVAYRGGEVVDYQVQSGETLSSIAQKYSLKVETIMWANGLDSPKTKIRQGQTIKIPPVDGIIHRVKKGDTVYSLAKYYKTNAQGIVDYPFNSFTNDESFALAIGQSLVVPDGVMPEIEVSPSPQFIAQAPSGAGGASGTGQFVWPASGVLTQGFKWYHKALDIAAPVGTQIIAADGGRVTVAGWTDNTGYGNRVMIDHGNGYVTLYGHMSKIDVVVGQSVTRGQRLGAMGSTGRSTGPHVHFEIRAAGGLQNPLNFLK